MGDYRPSARSSTAATWRAKVGLDRFLHFYNFERTHQGYRVNGRTPARAMVEGLATARLPMLLGQQQEEVTQPLHLQSLPAGPGVGATFNLHRPRKSA